ncbi:MAG TPA: hypothetical protein VK675_04920 [Candidatus Paceibacterota bacterium]|nr:hypothetical protein [Candidatus Paceibacterota bacterium]
MTEKLKQIIKEEVMKLPNEAQEAIDSLDWARMAEEIGKTFLLTESQINDLQVETFLVLIGIDDGNYYAQNIENKVGTTTDEAEKIAEEAFQKIFTPINDVLVENIKKSYKSKNPKPEQTLNFILSGGDYTAFLEQPIDTNMREFQDTQETVLPVFSIKKENLKDNNPVTE